MFIASALWEGENSWGEIVLNYVGCFPEVVWCKWSQWGGEGGGQEGGGRGRMLYLGIFTTLCNFLWSRAKLLSSEEVEALVCFGYSFNMGELGQIAQELEVLGQLHFWQH